MAYKRFALYFKRIDLIFYEIIANLFTQPFVSASFTHLNPSNLLRSNYQTHRLTKIQITVTFFLLILKICLQKKNCLYIWRERE